MTFSVTSSEYRQGTDSGGLSTSTYGAPEPLGLIGFKFETPFTLGKPQKSFFCDPAAKRGKNNFLKLLKNLKNLTTKLQGVFVAGPLKKNFFAASLSSDEGGVNVSTFFEN